MAVIVFTCFRVLNFILKSVNTSLKIKYHLNELIQAIEFISWIALIIWILRIIYVSENYFALVSISVVFLLLAVPIFFLIREYVSGLYLKLQNRIPEGVIIELDEIKGRIKKAGYFSFEIEDSHGNICTVSYYKINSKILIKPAKNQNLEKATIEFQIHDENKVNEIFAQLKKEVMNTPWVALSQPPIIENTRYDNGNLIIEICVFLLDRAYAEEIEYLVSQHSAFKMNKAITRF